jgi:hypothetical protein
MPNWEKQLNQLLKRIGRQVEAGTDQEKAVISKVKAFLVALGPATTTGYWRQIKRLGPDGSKLIQAHGLPDLLDAWDFTFDLEKSRLEYITEEV